MQPPTPEADDTVKIPRGITPRASLPAGPPAGAPPAVRGPKRRQFLMPLLAGTGLLVPAALAGAWFGFKPRGGGNTLITLTEAQIDASAPCATVVSAFALDRAVVVIDFPDLATQGLTLDRVAALIEKAHLPRNRVLTDAELVQAIRSSGDTIESYYYGHDYQAADLAKFFHLAALQNIRLNPHEMWLHALLARLGWLAPGVCGAIITIPAASAVIAPDMRAVILHHEISHGAFYTDAVYRSYAESFWYSLTDSDRAAFTGFLGRQGYDTTDTELMLNETQAYLVFTRDPRFFNAAAVGMTEADIARLRAAFIANMPDFWLRPLANAVLPPGAPPNPACRTIPAAPANFASIAPPQPACRICAAARPRLACA